MARDNNTGSNDELALIISDSSYIYNEPRIYNEAISCQNRKEWLDAMTSEINKLIA
jgi:hypothetical protein